MRYEPDILSLFWAMWAELHEKREADKEWLAEWLDRLPEDGVYRENTKALLNILPPDYEAFHAWGFMFHDVVNFALGKRLRKILPTEISQQIARLPWSKSKGGRTGRCGGCMQRRIR